MTSALQISDRLLDAILAKKLEPGSRLGEQQLAELFGCSRTIVREALVRLETREASYRSAPAAGGTCWSRRKNRQGKRSRPDS
ncbi:DNA-binding GntR family transcriptional regulator [Bradyrhizobium sp. JR6.1]